VERGRFGTCESGLARGEKGSLPRVGFDTKLDLLTVCLVTMLILGGEQMSDGEIVVGPGRAHAPVILLVEDEVLIRLSLAEPLRDEGYVVLEAGNASEAVALVSTGHPVDLAITDVRMPGEMDGVALTAALKDMLPALPVILISADMSPDRHHRGEAFVRKPFELEEIFNLIGELMDPEWQNKRQIRDAS